MAYGNDITAFGDRMIAAGAFWPDPDNREYPRVAVWGSEDGQRWSFAGDAEDGLGMGSVEVIAAGDGVVLALGEELPGWRPMAWRSVDGVNWEQVAMPGSEVPADLVWTGEWFVATASGEPDVVWTSTDGLEWDLRTSEPPFGPADIPVNDTERAPGLLTLVGDRIVLFGARSVAVSDDFGQSWAQRTLAEAGLAEASPTPNTRIEVLPDGTLLAVARTEPESEPDPVELAAYASADGLSWEPRGRFGLGVHPSDLAVAADGTIAAVGVTGDPGRATVWTSQDGGWSWAENADPNGVFGPGTGLSGVTVTDSGLVAVGWVEESGFFRGAAWITGPAAAPTSRPSLLG